MASSPSLSLMFTVRRCEPELVVPAKPTPRELKLLSDIDDQVALRVHVPMIQVYRNETSMAEKDPVEVIRRALAQTLVLYYPFAGRLREGPGRKLTVDCTGEGVLFIEADADVTLDQFGDTIQSPIIPCFRELLDDVPGSQEITNSPLLLIQVTRLKCGGFILAFKFNHTMCDAVGILQFMNTWAQFSRGETKPSIVPVWRRELLMARDPPRVTCNHREYEQVEGTITSNENNMVLRSFVFGSTDIATLRRLVPHNFQHCATFDLITACLWRSRTKALQIDADEDVRLIVAVNARARFNPPLPVGYYGNVIAGPAVVTTAGKLCGNPFEYAVELISKVKAEVTEEYMHSVADLHANKEQYVPILTDRLLLVSDLRFFSFRKINFGWGDAVYGGVAQDEHDIFHAISTWFVPFKIEKGEQGILFAIQLPLEAMNRFEKELDGMLRFVSRS